MPSKSDLSLPEEKPLGHKSWDNKVIELHK
jgi:hypothetical protein